MPPADSMETSHDDSTGDFGAHLQRRFGISRVELGECLTRYRPARAYAILVEDDARSSAELPAA